MKTKSSDVTISTDDVRLAAIWRTVPESLGVVAFAHGSGSSRYSVRNQYVASVLEQAGLATLLLDLLTPEEEEEDRRTARLRFDIPLLARRLEGASRWVHAESDGLPLGLFGASTGAAAALIAAAHLPDDVHAVVSRGGRVDMAADVLAAVKAPTLCIVGSHDQQVLALNEAAARQLRSPCELAVIEGASHLFEERGALERVAELARDWFLRYLTA